MSENGLNLNVALVGRSNASDACVVQRFDRERMTQPKPETEKDPDYVHACRQARDAVQHSGRVSESSGVSANAFLLGLWQVAIGTLLAAGDPQDVCALLVNRTSRIEGFGRNADVPPINYDDNGLRRHAAAASYAAETIVGFLDECESHPSEDEENDPMPEALLDTALGVLSEAWGPVFLRAALREQIQAIESGRDKPIMPREPSLPNNLGGTRKQEWQKPKPVTVSRQAGSLRRIDVVVEVAPTKTTVAWAIVASIECETERRVELREIVGDQPGVGARAAHIGACIEAFRLFGERVPGDKFNISTNSGFIVSGMTFADESFEASLNEEEARLWLEMERASNDWEAEWRLREPGSDRAIDEKCDRIIKRKLADCARRAG